MLKGGVTCRKCGVKKSVVRYFSVCGAMAVVCDDCWRRMNKNERRAFLRSFRKATEQENKEEL